MPTASGHRSVHYSSGGNRKPEQGEDQDGFEREFLVYRNGDRRFRPVKWTFNSDKHKSFEDVLDDIDELAPPIIKEDQIDYLYTPRGRRKNRIMDLDQLKHTIASELVACADDYIELSGGMTYDKLKNYMPPLDEEEFVYTGDGRFKGKGSYREDKSQSVFNRKKNGVFVYLFQNGKGYKSIPKVFNQSQLNQGLDFLYEIISKTYGRKVYRVCTMEGRPLTDPEDFIDRGAYVVVFKDNRKFDRKDYYYLPDGAIDTSQQDPTANDEEEGAEKE